MKQNCMFCPSRAGICLRFLPSKGKSVSTNNYFGSASPTPSLVGSGAACKPLTEWLKRCLSEIWDMFVYLSSQKDHVTGGPLPDQSEQVSRSTHIVAELVPLHPEMCWTHSSLPLLSVIMKFSSDRNFKDLSPLDSMNKFIPSLSICFFSLPSAPLVFQP